MQVNDELVRNVVAEVLLHMQKRSALPPAANGNGRTATPARPGASSRM